VTRLPIPCVASAVAVLAVAALAPAPARAQDAERLAMANLRLSTEPGIARGCTRIGFVSDDSLKDLRRKIVRTGGDTAVLSFRQDDLSRIQAEIYRCAGAGSPTAPPAPPPPPVPPPPPPPPPPVTR
jgi:hypothetical protein